MEMITTYVTSPYSAAEDIKYLESIPKLFIHSKGDKKVFWEYEGNHLESALKYPKEYIHRINGLLDDGKRKSFLK